jgi:2-iminobutanoate/2-iminopropanoate deaminase
MLLATRQNRYRSANERVKQQCGCYQKLGASRFKTGDLSMRNTVQLPLGDSWIERGQEPIVASRIGNVVFTSGVPGIDLKTGKAPEGPERQFALAFDNLMEVLRQAGAGPDAVGLLTVWIPDRTNRAYINKDWLRYYPGPNKPARKTNQAPLPAGLDVQLMAACFVGETRRPLEIAGLSHKDPLPMGAKLGPLVFSSVIAPEDPANGKLVVGALPQIDRAFENMKLLMQAAGASDAEINHVWVFMKDFAFQPAMVERWVRDYPRFGNRPARKTLPYDLAGDSQIQVQLTGYLGGTRSNYEVPGVGHDDPIPMGSSIGPLLQSSGMFGIDPKTGKRVEGLEGQLPRAIGNVRSLLEQAGTTPDRIAHLTVMLQDYADAPKIREALGALFPDRNNWPALKFVTYRMPAHWRVQFHVTAWMD